jgi:hypothetical protein
MVSVVVLLKTPRVRMEALVPTVLRTVLLPTTVNQLQCVIFHWFGVCPFISVQSLVVCVINKETLLKSFFEDCSNAAKKQLTVYIRSFKRYCRKVPCWSQVILTVEQFHVGPKLF